MYAMWIFHYSLHCAILNQYGNLRNVILSSKTLTFCLLAYRLCSILPLNQYSLRFYIYWSRRKKYCTRNIKGVTLHTMLSTLIRFDRRKVLYIYWSSDFMKHSVVKKNKYLFSCTDFIGILKWFAFICFSYFHTRHTGASRIKKRKNQ